jgi:hypothetical protein
MVARVEGLRGLGIGMALDDFGRGFWSRAHLKSFPVITMKSREAQQDRTARLWRAGPAAARPHDYAVHRGLARMPGPCVPQVTVLTSFVRLVLDVGTWVKAVITPDDPEQAAAGRNY